jgi:hypothetical protein
MNTDALIAKVKNHISVELSEGTLNRWARNGLITRTIAGCKGGGRGADWPPEAVEEAATIYILRSMHFPRAQGRAPGIVRTSVLTKQLLEAKKVVDRFYAGVAVSRLSGDYRDIPNMAVSAGVTLPVDVDQNRKKALVVDAVRAIETPRSDGNRIALPPALSWDGSAELKYAARMKKRADKGDPDAVVWMEKCRKYLHRYTYAVFGHSSLHGLIVMWIATLEKIRHGKPLNAPAKVTFSWNWHVLRPDAGKIIKQLNYDGVSFEPSARDIININCGRTRDVP